MYDRDIDANEVISVEQFPQTPELEVSDKVPESIGNVRYSVQIQGVCPELRMFGKPFGSTKDRVLSLP